MTRPNDFQDVEVAVMTLLRAKFSALATPSGGSPRVATATPPNLASVLPFARVALVTGSDDRVTDFSVVDVDAFDVDREATRLLAESIRTFLTAKSHQSGGFIIDSISTETKPHPLPWDIAGVHRYGATYRISARR
jgi:hypothetical protein